MSLLATQRAEILLFAQPYSLDASGFYFNNYDDYVSKSSKLKNSFGDPVEEFELQFIDGDSLECLLFKALRVSQVTLKAYLTFIDTADNDEMIKIIIADDAGYTVDLDDLDFDIDIYPNINIRELAEQFLDDGLFGEIPENIASYIDYDAVARDLGYDYSEITIDGVNYTYRAN